MKTETVWIECADAKLYGKLYIPNAVPAPAVLICHGLNAQGSNGLRLYARLAENACKEGFVALLFDFRGVGKSTGKFDYGIGEQQDVKCALNYLASRPEVAPNKIFVVGHSLGGAVSLCALQNETRVKGLVLWSTPKNHNYNVRKFIRRTRGTLGLYAFLAFSRIDKVLDISRLLNLEVYGVKLRPRDVREKLMKLNECEAASKLRNIPLLVVIGEKDNIVGVDEAEEIYRSANEPKSLLTINGADHIYKGKEQELIAKTVDWIKKVGQ
ncbi:MAG: alpha/beta fold hydrolase [Candidatus Bathyarchaeota archaeon]|nr:alpha/beta fold hydrolase [Candidatus Bathyarchaeota archaeon A05DMB-5]MDH7557627.1 alpha/beta fold hydrolase [Candidatus Bathyarchaeota archaeon]